MVTHKWMLGGGGVLSNNNKNHHPLPLTKGKMLEDFQLATVNMAVLSSPKFNKCLYGS